MQLANLFSGKCCGGPVLALALFCAGLGALLVFLSASTPGLVFFTVAGIALGSCLLIGRRLCRERASPSGTGC